MLDDDHRSVFEVADALMKFFTLANDRDVKLLTGSTTGLTALASSLTFRT